MKKLAEDYRVGYEKMMAEMKEEYLRSLPEIESDDTEKTGSLMLRECPKCGLLGGGCGCEDGFKR